MKSKNVPAIVIIVVSLAVSGSMALAAQDRFTLKAPNGVAFSEITSVVIMGAISS